MLHEQVVTLAVVTERAPTVTGARWLRSTDLGYGIPQVELHYGFMQQSRVADDLRDHLGIQPGHATYFLGRELVIVTGRPGMAKWRDHLFTLMRRNGRSAADSFGLPSNRVFEISTRADL